MTDRIADFWDAWEFAYWVPIACDDSLEEVPAGILEEAIEGEFTEDQT